jgi:hypothetical protein
MALLALFGTVCLAGEAERPPCNAKQRGRLWPEEANTSREASRRAERCGNLQMCAVGVWRYRWQPLTVHVSQLGKGPKREIPGCDASERVARLHEDRAQR